MQLAEQSICGCVEETIKSGRPANVTLSETVKSYPSGEFQHIIVYSVNRNKEGMVDPLTPDEEPVSRDYARDLAGMVRNIENTVVTDGWSSKDGLRSGFRVQNKDYFKVPVRKNFTFDQVIDLLKIGASRLLDNDLVVGKVLELDGANGYLVNDLARNYGVSPSKLAEGYQNLFKEK